MIILFFILLKIRASAFQQFDPLLNATNNMKALDDINNLKNSFFQTVQSTDPNYKMTEKYIKDEFKFIIDKIKKDNESIKEKLKKYFKNDFCYRKMDLAKIRENGNTQNKLDNSFALLTHDRLTFFQNQFNEEEIDGSIELKYIVLPIQKIKFQNCMKIFSFQGY